MAPSDGQRCQTHFKIIFVLSLFTCGCRSAQVAKNDYYMDKRTDCISVGFLDVRRDQITYVLARSTTPETSPQLSCTLQFKPQTRGDTLKLWSLGIAHLSECGASLSIKMTDNNLFQMGCPSNTNTQPPNMEARDGQLSIRITRTSYSQTDYNFHLAVQAVQSVADSGGSDSGSDLSIGAIVGIVGGVIVVFIIIVIFCVCCYMRSQKSDKVQGVVVSIGEKSENKMLQNGVGVNSSEGSPSSDRRLLGRNDEDGYPSGKTALERFGPVESRQRTRGNNRDIDVEAGQQRNVREPRNEKVEDDVKRSPLLSDLHRNPKFRRSFHENEVDAEDRANRISYTSENSTESVNSRGVPLPPKLPPVPKSPPRSPSPHRRGEKIAQVSRDRPLSSSSDLPRQLDGDGSPDEASEDDRRAKKKTDTRHTLKPNRGERKSRRDEDDDSEEERRRRRKERSRERRERELEKEEEERRRRKKDERRRREREEEEDEREKRRNRHEKDHDDDRPEYEGRFKKSASGRKSKGKAPRIGRSRSTGNPLEEMERDYQRSRSKSPSSVRSLNFIEDDDDDDLDSNYVPFKRSGSKTSLYASRSSLYGRRRKNSVGETMSLSSYAYDDADSRFGDFDKRGLSHKEKDRLFRSTGELEMQTASAQVVRECSTQTGADKPVQIYGRKTIAKSRPGRMYSRGCQAGVGRERRDSTGSARSGRSGRSSKSRLKHKSRSQESLSKSRRSRSRNLDDSDDSDDRRSRKSRSRSRNLDYSDDDDESRRGGRKHHRSKSRGLDDDDSGDRQSSRGGRSKPKHRPRKSTGAASVDLSDSDGVSDGGRSAAASSIAASMAHPPPPQPNPYGPQFIPVAYPHGPVTFLPTAPGGPPMVPAMHAAGGGVKPPVGPKPAVAPKPQKSKWDTLVEMTEGERQRRRHAGDLPSDTESMLSSVYGHPVGNGAHAANVYAPPSYTTAQRYPNPNSTINSSYPDSSGPPHSARGPREYKLDSYPPSESMI